MRPRVGALAPEAKRRQLLSSQARDVGGWDVGREGRLAEHTDVHDERLDAELAQPLPDLERQRVGVAVRQVAGERAVAVHPEGPGVVGQQDVDAGPIGGLRDQPDPGAAEHERLAARLHRCEPLENLRPRELPHRMATITRSAGIDSSVPHGERTAPMSAYPHLFSEWRIRNTTLKNRVVFPPTCPTWVSDPWNGLFTEQATKYYAERANGGVGLIIIGATHVHESSLMAPLLMPQLWDDRNIEPLSEIADAVHAAGCKLAIQLWHSGVRGFPIYKQETQFDLDATWYTLSPSQVPLGEFPGASTPKELSGEEIEEILDAYGSAAAPGIAAGLDGVEFHMSHGYLPWQFLSPFYNQRTDCWGGSYENRLRFPVEALARIRAAIGDEPFLGYRINSTSFWPGDLELDDVKQIVADFEARSDVDYVNLSAGV